MTGLSMLSIGVFRSQTIFTRQFVDQCDHIHLVTSDIIDILVGEARSDVV